MHEALTLALASGDDETALRAYINLSDLLAGAGHFRESAAAAQAGLELAKRVGLSRREGIFTSINLAEALIMEGDWDGAESVIAEAMGNASGMPNEWVVERFLDLAVARGDLDAARPYLGSAARLQPQMRAGRILNLAEVARQEGRLVDARHILAEGLGYSALGPRYVWAEVCLALRVEADLAQTARNLRGPTDPEHLPSVEAILAAATSLPTDLITLQAFDAMSRAEHARTTGTRSIPAWAETVERWRQAGEPARLAYALFRLAEAQVEARDRDTAAPSLTEAFAIARGLRGTPLLADIQDLAVRARMDTDHSGHRDTDADDSEPLPLGLTDREFAVLRLLTEGKSNGEIAADLYISPKTASVHVSRILTKLGVTKRGEAAALANRLHYFTE
jgi:DNA-binding CsgD family transcriptional regulator